MRNKLTEIEKEKILKFGPQELFTERSKEALEYLKNTRGFSEEIIKKFSLGYMPQNVNNCEGQVHELSGRIIIPIIDQYDDLVAFSSRDWRENCKKPFWHESYQKSNYVYALNIAKKSIIRNKKAIIVEGEFDVIKLHQFNIDCAVGVCGSAPQLFQIALLRRYCKEIFLVFDGDVAGAAASDRITKDKMVGFFNQAFYDTNLISVKLPNKKDPDDYIKEYGAKAFINLLQEAKNKYKDK